VTASAVTLLPGPVPTLVLTAEAGVPVEYAVDGVAHPLVPSRVPTRIAAGGRLDLLVLPAADAPLVWLCGDRLVLSPDELTWSPDGVLTAAGPEVLVYDPRTPGFAPLPLDLGAGAAADAAVSPVRAAGRAVPVAYGKFDGRPSAPSAETFEELAAIYRLEVPDWAADPALDALLRIGWAGDVGALRVDGRTVTDRFWDGSEWIVSLRDVGFRPGSRVSLHLLPLAAGSPVALPRDARDRLLASDGQLLALDYVRVTGRPSTSYRLPA
jgi:beta-galactosidase